VAFSGANDGADKAQNPTPKAQVQDEAEYDEALIPSARTEEGEMLGSAIAITLGLFGCAFVVTMTGPMVGTDGYAMPGADNAALVSTMPGL
jgi:hypothetical protein